jgi:SAM-dependent methyltransferase
MIAVDLAATMVSRLRTFLPGVVSLRGAAGNLPFHDASLGAINCWNALQSMADPAHVIREVGRCLRDDGTFTLLTFARSTDPVYRFFQREHEQCLTVCSFPVEDIHQMLREARLEITDYVLSGTTLILTATRIPAGNGCTRS